MRAPGPAIHAAACQAAARPARGVAQGDDRRAVEPVGESASKLGFRAYSRVDQKRSLARRRAFALAAMIRPAGPRQERAVGVVCERVALPCDDRRRRCNGGVVRPQRVGVVCVVMAARWSRPDEIAGSREPRHRHLGRSRVAFDGIYGRAPHTSAVEESERRSRLRAQRARSCSARSTTRTR